MESYYILEVKADGTLEKIGDEIYSEQRLSHKMLEWTEDRVSSKFIGVKVINELILDENGERLNGVFIFYQ